MIGDEGSMQFIPLPPMSLVSSWTLRPDDFLHLFLSSAAAVIIDLCSALAMAWRLPLTTWWKGCTSARP